MNRQIQPGYEILLNAQFAHIEGMINILGVHKEMNFPIDRNRELSGHDVILRIRVAVGIKTKKILVALINLVRVKRTKLSIRPGVAKIKKQIVRLEFEPGLRWRRVQ